MKKLITKLLITNCALVAAFVAQAHAAHPSDSGAIPTCGTLESFLGHVQVFDASRTQVIDVTPRQKLACGSWISVEDGVAVVNHRQGFEVQIGAKTFVQILDTNWGSNPDRDHFTLLRGQMVLEAKAKKNLQVSTANARVNVSQAKAYLIYSTDFNETQLLGLEGQSEIQNRYLETRGIRVSQSQYSTLGFNPSRPTPAQPKVVAVKAVKDRLQQLGVSQDLSKQMLGEAKALAQTQMPTTLKSEVPSRGIASVVEHPEFKPTDHQAEETIPSRFQGGATENVVHHGAKAKPAPRKVHAAQTEKRPSRAPAQQSSEKQKLLKELSAIQDEE